MPYLRQMQPVLPFTIRRSYAGLFGIPLSKCPTAYIPVLYFYFVAMFVFLATLVIMAVTEWVDSEDITAKANGILSTWRRALAHRIASARFSLNEFAPSRSPRVL
jgi:hypothetical protein